jgi:four helix bundle suffix protein
MTYSSYIENAPPEVAANTMLCLVHQTNYLLDQQLRQLEQAFLKEGGFTERLYHARQQVRGLDRSNRPHAPPSTKNPPAGR